MKKKVLAMLLVCVLVIGLLAACGSTNTSTTPPAEDTKPTDSAPTDNQQEPTAEEPAPAPADAEEDEVVEINFRLVVINSIDSDVADGIAEAINEITIPAIGVAVNLQVTQMGSYPSTLSMAISGGEQIDLCSVYCVSPVDFPTMFANGQLMDIKDELETYGQDLLATVGDFINAYSLNGGIYGVPVYRNYAGSQYLYMRTDVLEELGLTESVKDMHTFSQLESVFEQVKNETDLYGIGANRSVLWMPTGCTAWYDDDWNNYALYDCIGDSALAVLRVQEDAVVTNVYASDEFKWVCEKTRDWYKAGYIWPDAQLEGEHGDTIMKQGILFSLIQPCELGVETAKKQATGYDVTCFDLGDSMIDTGSVVKFGCGVPVTAKEPEAAVKFLNLLYTSHDLMNLLDWGIEGRDYEITATGEAGYINDNAEVPYHVQDFIFGNYYLVSPWKGDGADFRDRAMATMNNAEISWFLGFSFNSSDLTDQIAAITAVRNEYYYTLTTGNYSDELYQEYLDKLAVAGVDDYIAAAQTQLDAFLASK